MFRLLSVAVLALSLMATGAQAHSSLASSDPADGATVTAPKTLHLQFTDAVRLVTVKLTNDAAEEIDVPVDRKAAPAKMFMLALPTLAAGSYSVRWSTSAGDGHVMKGTFSFTVTAGKP